ncbi:zinc-dependent alcohol dehydrogenase family protein [Gottfriedia acidiceleris]|uniref:Zinc-dependent alcohol dehydrogenase family protein n=1 Tax=Gottfriedia acidiceleris TaxID=371036 RepID=A0ABY4JP07_9BACI|nr:zinc-dependent alcohol dehydrogenase family protein [Gottfriedia acidiceleris]UPM55222.1 zinc-dependent alcohol dehydrogenase family protein [Gottfriedia acidiceleris]
MKAAVLEEFNKPLVIKNVADPVLSADGVILRLEATGVCRSDWHAWQGHLTAPTSEKLPHILGHEMSGVIEETGKNIKKFKKGDRVIVPFNQGDGVCPYCVAGRHNICDNRKLVGFDFYGGFASHIHIPNADLNLFHLPENVSFIDASAMGCRFMTAYHGVMSQGKIKAGDWVSIYGAGGVGLSAIQIAVSAGANVIAVDIGDDKLDLAKKFGAVASINSKRDDAPQAIKEITKGGSNLSIDALGIQDTVIGSIMSLKKGGRHVQLGLSPNPGGGMTPLPLNLILGYELEIIGSAGMPMPEYSTLIRMVEMGQLQPGKLVTKEISLEEVNQAFEDMNSFSGTGMTVITKF